MAYKSVKLFETFKTNPFVEAAIKDMKIVRKTQVMRATDKSEISLIVSDQGEVEGHTQFLRFVEVDESQFAKVYLSQFSAFWDLSKPAIRVFGYILTVLFPKKDSFIFKLNDCLEYTKYKHVKDINTGLSSLIECGIIARSNYDFEYFINPMVMFNGDRVTFARTYIKKKQAALNPNQLDMFGEPIKEIKASHSPI
jgi:hypothetical protein